MLVGGMALVALATVAIVSRVRPVRRVVMGA